MIHGQPPNHHQGFTTKPPPLTAFLSIHKNNCATVTGVFEKQSVEVQDFRKSTNCFTRIFGIYLKPKHRNMATGRNWKH